MSENDPTNVVVASGSFCVGKKSAFCDSTVGLVVDVRNGILTKT
jgi:hypothetical protein